MKKKTNMVGRYVFLGASLIALIILGVSVGASSQPFEDDSTLDVNNKYSIRRNKQLIGEIEIYYPTIENMAEKSIEDKINQVLLKQKDVYTKMAENNTLNQVDFKATYTGNEILSILFLGEVNIVKKAEMYKAFNFNVNTGEEISLNELIEDEILGSQEFKELVNKKLDSNGIKSNVVIEKDSNYYLESAISTHNYVFFFAENDDSTTMSKIKISNNEITTIRNNLGKSGDEEETDKEENNDGNDKNDNDEENNSGGALKFDIVDIDKKDEAIVSDTISINDEDITLQGNNKIFLLNGRIMLPIKEMLKNSQYKVTEEGEEVRVKYDSQYITLKIGEDRYFFTEEKPFKLGVSVTRREDVAFVPVEFFTAILKMEAEVKENKVYLKYDKNSVANEELS